MLRERQQRVVPVDLEPGALHVRSEPAPLLRVILVLTQGEIARTVVGLEDNALPIWRRLRLAFLVVTDTAPLGGTWRRRSVHDEADSWERDSRAACETLTKTVVRDFDDMHKVW